jgi:hypothetical protein
MAYELESTLEDQHGLRAITYRGRRAHMPIKDSLPQSAEHFDAVRRRSGLDR